MRLDELRSNPDKNPKSASMDTLLKYEGRKDVFVSFTADVGWMSHGANETKSRRIVVDGKEYWVTLRDEGDWMFTYHSRPTDPEERERVEKKISAFLGKRMNRNVRGAKVGINPRSTYGTPLGVYCYPIDYVIAYSKRTGQIGADFTGSTTWQYAWIIESGLSPEQTFQIQKVTPGQQQAARENLMMVLSKHGVDEEDATRFLDEAEKDALNDKPATKIWNMARTVAAYIVGADDMPESQGKSRTAVKWSALMRLLGYGLAVDLGDGLIHSNERTQAVFFDPTGYRRLDVISRSEDFYKQIIRYSSRADTSWNTEDKIKQIPPFALYKIVKDWIGREDVDDLRQNAEVLRRIRERFESTIPRYLDFLVDSMLADGQSRKAPLLLDRPLNDGELVRFAKMFPSAIQTIAESGYDVTDDMIVASLSNPENTATTLTWMERNKHFLSEASVLRALRTDLLHITDSANNDMRAFFRRLIELSNLSDESLVKIVRKYPKYLLPRFAQVMPTNVVYTILRRNPDLLNDAHNIPMPENAIKSFVKDDPAFVLAFSNVPDHLVLAAFKEADDTKFVQMLSKFALNHEPFPALLRYCFDRNADQTMARFDKRHEAALLNAVGESKIVDAVRAKPFLLASYISQPTEAMLVAYAEAGGGLTTLPHRMWPLFRDNETIVRAFIKARPANILVLAYGEAKLAGVLSKNEAIETLMRIGELPSEVGRVDLLFKALGFTNEEAAEAIARIALFKFEQELNDSMGAPKRARNFLTAMCDQHVERARLIFEHIWKANNEPLILAMLVARSGSFCTDEQIARALVKYSTPNNEIYVSGLNASRRENVKELLRGKSIIAYVYWTGGKEMVQQDLFTFYDAVHHQQRALVHIDADVLRKFAIPFLAKHPDTWKAIARFTGLSYREVFAADEKVADLIEPYTQT